MKKRTLLFLSLCASALNAQLVQADMVNAPSSQVSSSQVAETGGQLSVVDEAGQIKAILSNIQGEIIGVTAQFSSETNSGITVTFSMDEQGRYVAVLDRSAFAEEDQVFSLELTAQLTDGSFQTLSDYSFEWKKDVVSAAEKPTALNNSNAISSKIEEEAISTTTSSTVNSSLTAGTTSSTSNSLTRSSSNTIAGSSNGSTSVPSARVSTASSSVNVTQPTGIITIENRNDAQGTFDIRVTNVSSPRGLDKVYVPTWTESGGQDDIVWHEASRQSDGSYLARINKNQHKYESGKYISHVYYRGHDGSMTAIGGASVELPELKSTGTITIENRNDAQGTFDVRVTNVSSPRGLDKVYVPTWTESGGQDDIVWHEASRQSDGSYLARINKNQHKYESGKYISHVYYRGHDGSMTAIGGASVELPELKSTGTITIENRNDAQGTFDVRVTNVSSPRGLDKVYVPTWTESGGQDDIVWHEASRQSDGSYLARINKNQHKYESGKYISHVYYRGHDGSMTAIGGASVELPELKSTGTITIENRNDAQGTFDVRVTNVSSPRGLDKVYVPTWTESGGQDDIVWHEASRQSDGSYLARINKTQHKYESGKYISHVYYRGHDGSMTAIGGASVELPELKLSGTITVSDVNVQAGSFKVRITNISSPRGLDKVYVPTWTESGGQDDIVWHEASRQSDGSYLARINKTQHKYSSGKYISHVYYRGTDGSMTAVGGTSVELPSTRSYTVYIDPGHGGRDSGASYGGVHEKNLALSVSNKLRENLLKYGINVLMTRTGDYDVDFKTERSRMTNASNADLFISIHFNATGAGVSNATGIETYWYQYDPEYQPKINKEMHNNPTRLAESEILANKVQESLIKETGAVNRGVRRETFAVLRETAIPAILVELGFMDNPSELQVIKQDSYHTRLAKALAQGVMNWYGAVEGK
ncbi:GBS Bsp-like repeat-containing protein [Streptococcus suis]|uniref:GBS Bsp-like repeat-containing protein n=4 Tax=Streptococcus suis TaxID=1307 RepID=UPI001C930BEC|nr:GBS Bsp-like repeat-containing protein [Streptococcus suis]MBY4600196.1 GBS Bsp-like repeat-containing protein [Streptococcus suis]MCO8225811.1 GBS Bsp-like repeat-containing protein [Streptococcus suis]